MPRSPRFTERDITNTKPGTKTLVWDTPGLYLMHDPPSKKHPQGLKRWMLRYTRPKNATLKNGQKPKCRVTEMQIGHLHYVNLNKARTLVHHLRQQFITVGVDPLEAKQWQKQEGATFGEVAQMWIDKEKLNKGERWVRQANLFLLVHCAPLVNVPLLHIKPEAIHKALESLYGTHPKQARLVMSMTEKVFRFAKSKRLRAGENPASWKEVQRDLFPTLPKTQQRNHAEMYHGRIPNFMHSLRQLQGGAVAARALEFCILTATRTSETLKMRWTEFNAKEHVWSIPAMRMRAREEHTVPLSDRAMELLALQRQYSRGSEYVFNGRNIHQPLAQNSMRHFLRSMGEQRATIHGFRATFKTWATELTAFPWELVEMSLAHEVGTEVAQRYQRGEALKRRREVMDAWAEYCDHHSPGRDG
jgi:integrase